MATFCTPLDLVAATLASAHTTGSGSLVLTTGHGARFGTPSATAPVRVTVCDLTALDQSGMVRDSSKVGIFRCASRTLDTLTVTLDSGTDFAFIAGSRVSVEINGQTVADLHTAINGGAMAVVSKTTTYTATAADYLILCSAAGGAWTLTLPTAVGIAGKPYSIKKTDATGLAITVDANGSQTIDGALTQVITEQYTTLTIVSDGANWVIL